MLLTGGGIDDPLRGENQAVPETTETLPTSYCHDCGFPYSVDREFVQSIVRVGSVCPEKLEEGPRNPAGNLDS